MSESLKGKVAVVTGGTRGIGNAIVRKFVEEGAKVVLCGSRQATAEKALEALKKDYPDAIVSAIWPALSDRASVTEAFVKVREEFGAIDILANNAGISHNNSFFDYKDEDFDKIIDINIRAVYVCTRAAAEIMKEQGRGVIINTSSVVSINGQAAGCGYPASKFAVNGLTISLARELGPLGIRVNAVAPGVTMTDMMAVLPDEMIQPIIAKIPLRRVGQPEDIANAFAFLASDMASYINGAVLPVTGGVVI